MLPTASRYPPSVTPNRSSTRARSSAPRGSPNTGLGALGATTTGALESPSSRTCSATGSLTVTMTRASRRFARSRGTWVTTYSRLYHSGFVSTKRSCTTTMCRRWTSGARLVRDRSTSWRVIHGRVVCTQSQLRAPDDAMPADGVARVTPCLPSSARAISVA